MYKSFFGLKENPFNVNPDPRFLFLTQQMITLSLQWHTRPFILH